MAASSVSASPTLTWTSQQRALLQDLGIDPNSSQAHSAIVDGQKLCSEVVSLSTTQLAASLRSRAAAARGVAKSTIAHLCPRPDLDQAAAEAEGTSSSTPRAEPSATATRSSPEPSAPSVSPLGSPRASAGGTFDSKWADTCVNRIIESIQFADEQFKDPPIVSGTLYLLADDYDCLLTAGFPPGVDHGQFYSRVVTSRDYAQKAGDELLREPMQARARYDAVRQETPKLMDMVSKGTGKKYSLPPR
ncbi:hypothetical protein CGZ98_03555 [Enemella evansiae]|nr:hypothetical protein CGZ98_03555 [Enemella evansiae]